MGKKILSVALLGFVAVALVALIMRGQGGGGGSDVQSPPAPVTQTDPPAAPGAPVAIAKTPASTSRLVAFYFHGTKRCTSCNSIESLTREAL
ncbi:MAG: hypothetical protein ACRCUC_16540, partial [Aestuariivirga sp.]